MGKVLFIDVDGTLCSPRYNKVPESAVKAIRTARKNGHLVYICTGRSKAEIYDDIWEIGLDGMVGGNGCYVEDHGEVIWHQKLTREECRHIVDWCKSRNMEFYLECNSGLYPSEKYKEVSYAAYRKKFGRDPEYGDFFAKMIYGANLYRDDVNKISFRLNSWEDYLAAQKEFEDLHVGCWGGDAPNSTHGDVSPKGVNKARASRFLLGYIGKDKSEAIAFGDEAVDIPMFTLCGYSVAMGSGAQSAKDAADYVTAATDDDGLAKAFEYLGLLTKHAYTIYGSDLCPDCLACKANFDACEIPYTFLDINLSLKNLADFLALRDRETLFDDCRKNHAIGIPALVRDDSLATLDWQAIVKESGHEIIAANLPEETNS